MDRNLESLVVPDHNGIQILLLESFVRNYLSFVVMDYPLTNINNDYLRRSQWAQKEGKNQETKADQKEKHSCY
jgi:hypothetical protein